MDRILRAEDIAISGRADFLDAELTRVKDELRERDRRIRELANSEREARILRRRLDGLLSSRLVGTAIAARSLAVTVRNRRREVAPPDVPASVLPVPPSTGELSAYDAFKVRGSILAPRNLSRGPDDLDNISGEIAEARRLLLGGLNLPSRRLTSGRSPQGVRLLYAVSALPSDPPNGYDQRTRAVVRKLSDSGIQVVLCGLSRSRLFPHLNVGGVNGGDLPPNVVASVSLPPEPTRGIASNIDDFRFLLERVGSAWSCNAVLAASNYRIAASARLAAESLRIPMVYEVRGLWHLSEASRDPAWSASDRFRLDESLEREVLRSVDRVVTISESLADYLEEFAELDERPFVAANGTDVDEVRPISIASADLSEDCRFNFGFLGSLTKYENVALLLRAFANLSSFSIGGRRLGLRVAGDGEDRKNLERLAAELDIEGSVEFLGALTRQEVPGFFDSVDCLVYPRSDLPVTRLVPTLKIAEALSAGKPVIASRLPPNEIFPEDGAVTLVSPESTAALQSAMGDIASRKFEELDSLGRTARFRAVRDWAWSRTLETLVVATSCVLVRDLNDERDPLPAVTSIPFGALASVMAERFSAYLYGASVASRSCEDVGGTSEEASIATIVWISGALSSHALEAIKSASMVVGPPGLRRAVRSHLGEVVLPALLEVPGIQLSSPTKEELKIIRSVGCPSWRVLNSQPVSWRELVLTVEHLVSSGWLAGNSLCDVDRIGNNIYCAMRNAEGSLVGERRFFEIVEARLRAPRYLSGDRE